MDSIKEKFNRYDEFVSRYDLYIWDFDLTILKIHSFANEIKEDEPDLLDKIHIYNCGPEGMIDAVLPIEEQFIPKERIFCAIDYITKCGIGICGSCASK